MKFTDANILNLDDFFENFFASLLVELKFSNVSSGEQAILKEEIYKLFITTVYEATMQVLDTDEIYAIESELDTNSQLSEFDMYFAIAITKPSFLNTINLKLKELKDQIFIIKNKR